MKAVVLVRLYDGDGKQVAEFYTGTPGSPLVGDLDKARTFTNVGHAKNSIRHSAHDIAWCIRHGRLGEETGAKLARFFVVPVRLRLTATAAAEEYEP